MSDPRFKIQDNQIDKPIIFPRLMLSATEASIASGIFQKEKYKQLFFELNKWRDIGNEFNHRLDITEMRIFMKPEGPEIRMLYDGLMKSELLSEAHNFSNSIEKNLRARFSRSDIEKVRIIAEQNEQN